MNNPILDVLNEKAAPKETLAPKKEPPAPKETPTIDADNRPMPKSDPRPDLQEDSALWTSLLKRAWPYEVAWNLQYMRCLGTRLRRGKKGYVLRPDIDPTGRVAWRSQDEYDRDKKLLLAPYGPQIADLLDELTENERGAGS